MKNINKLLVAAAVLLAANSVRATLDIPDGSTIGVASSINVSGLSGTISSLSLNLDISGGNNGDLYAYLSYDGTVVTLLNQPGTSSSNPLGFTDAGYNVLVEDNGANGSLNAATGGNPVTGTYYAAAGATALGTAYGTDVNDGNGTWTLFIADLSGGDSSDSQLVSWYLNIDGVTVPEPIRWSLIIFAGGVVALTLSRRLLKRMA